MVLFGKHWDPNLGACKVRQQGCWTMHEPNLSAGTWLLQGYAYFCFHCNQSSVVVNYWSLFYSVYEIEILCDMICGIKPKFDYGCLWLRCSWCLVAKNSVKFQYAITSLYRNYWIRALHKSKIWDLHFVFGNREWTWVFKPVGCCRCSFRGLEPRNV